MIDLKAGLSTAMRIVDGKVKHRDYEHVCKLTREYYRPLITGKNVGHLLARFTRREDEQAYKQRLQLTQLITPAIHSTLMAPVRKVPRVKPIVDRVDFGTENKDAQERLQKAVSSYYAGKSVDHYMASVLLDQAAIDPNAFCLVTFDNFDSRTESPQPYPTLVSCEDAWNFEYRNGDLEWLMVHRAIKYKAKETPKLAEANPTKVKKQDKVATGKKPELIELDGNWFCMYLPEDQVVFRQIDPGTVSATVEHVLVDAKGRPVLESSIDGVTRAKEGMYYYRVSSVELYEVTFYQQKSGEVQAFRIGFRPDAETNGRTCVNFWHSALPFMLKGIKAGSELDITAALHAFLQKIQYANPCKGYTDEGGRQFDCNNGMEAGGKKSCRKCGGTGWDVITTAQDHMTIRLPRTKEEFLDLANLVHYVQLPVEVLNWQDGYVDKLEQKCYRAVYNTDRFRMDQVSTTATGDIIDLQSVYDAVQPVAEWWSQVRVKTYRLVGRFVVEEGTAKKMTVSHAFPRNLRFETVSEMVGLRKSMKEAGLAGSMLSQVDRDLIEHLYVDDPTAMKRALCMQSFDPFAGKDEATCTQLISQDLTTREIKVFWTNMSYVFSECEERAAESGVDFYDLARSKQQEMIDEVVDELVQEIEASAEQMQPRPMLGRAGEGEEAPGGGEAPPNGEELPASPGNTATA